MSAVGHAEYQPSRYIIIFNCIDNTSYLFIHSPIQSISVHKHSFTLSVYSIGQDGHMHCHPCSPSNGPTTGRWTQKSKQQTDACPRFNSNNNNNIVLVTASLHPFCPFSISCTIDIDTDIHNNSRSTLSQGMNTTAVLLVPFEGALRHTFLPQSDFVVQTMHFHISPFCCCLMMDGWLDTPMGTRTTIKRWANLATAMDEREEVSSPRHVLVVPTELELEKGRVVNVRWNEPDQTGEGCTLYRHPYAYFTPTQYPQHKRPPKVKRILPLYTS